MPSSGALFGSTATRNQSKNLVEFKAGKMIMKGKMVHPDKRKGLLYVHQSDDSLMHLCWKDRTSGTVEDDLIIFPDDCEFKKVEQCTTGRVYVLKFKSTNRKFFFWVQEPKTDKDEENCKKINEMLNNPPAASSSRSGGATPEGDLQNLLGSMSQQQLMQLFGSFGTSGTAGQLGGLSSLLGTMNRPNQSSARTTQPSSTASSGGATTTTTTTTTSDSSSSRTTAAAASTPLSSAPGASRSATAPATVPNPIQLSDLQQFLSTLAQPPNSQGSPVNVDLSDALNSESIAGVLNDPSLVRELSPHLPNVGGSESTEDQLRTTVTSPQFQQAVSMFSAALQSGQLGPVVQQFQVGDNAVNAANQGNMEEFVKALQNTNLNQEKKDDDEGKQVEKKKKTEGEASQKESKKDSDGDDEMPLG